MSIGDRIKFIRSKKKLSTNDLSRLTGISQSTISKLENSKRKADIELLEKIAEALNISIDRLTGESVSAIIDERLEELGITLEVVADKTKNAPPLHWLQNLDSFTPGEFGEHEIGYDWITRVAEILGLPPAKLRAALARQEIPVYDGPQYSTEEDFGNLEFKESLGEYKVNNLSPVEGKIVRIPLLGKIPAGVPVECEDNIIGFIDVPESEVKNGEYFYLRVEGDSMIGSGIMDGYNVLIRKQPYVENGEIAAVRVNSSEATLKKVKKVDGKCILYPDNPKYEPMIIDSNEATVIGKVVKVEFNPNKKY